MAQLKKILLVDDDEDLREALSEQLIMTEDFDVFEAANGQDVLVRAKEAIYDLVILDVRMPGLGGYEVLQRLQERNPKVRVIVVSGYSDAEEEVKQMLALGALTFLLRRTRPHSKQPKHVFSRWPAIAPEI